MIKSKAFVIAFFMFSSASLMAQNFWQPVSQEGISIVNAFASDGPGEIFVGAEEGIFHSIDNGETWRRLPSTRQTSALAINSRGDLYASSGLVLRSTDRGNTWQNTHFPYSSPQFIVINKSDEIFVEGGNAIVRSLNHGQNWSIHPIGLSEGWITGLTLTPLDHLLAGTTHGVYLSIDKGLSWQRLGLSQALVNCIAVNSLGHILVGTGGNDALLMDGQIFRSTDNGQNWKQVYQSGQTTGIVAMACNGGNQLFAVTYRDGILHSVDSGDTWTPANNGAINKLMRTVIALPWPEPAGTIFAGTWDSIIRSTNNAESWEVVASKITFVPALAINSSLHIFAGTTSGIFLSTDKGQTWRTRNNGLSNGYVRAMKIESPGKLFAGTAEGIFASSDDGLTWQAAGLATNEIYTIASNANGYLFAGTDAGVYRSNDNGRTWVLAGAELQNLKVQALATESLNNTFAGTTGGIYLSTDNGERWQPRNNGLDKLDVRALILGPGREMIAGTLPSLYHSSDAGENWVEIDAHTIGVYALANNLEGDIFAGTGNGVFRSKDAGRTWEQINHGLTTGTIWSLASDAEGYLWAGTDGGGIFRSVATTLAVQENLSDNPTSFSLAQNYPNPFNPSTTIQFDLPHAGFVTLKIYNTLGEEVASVLAQTLPAGRHQVRWEANGVAASIYLYRLQAGGLMETKKLLIVK
jgi:photosystem II stability/assembly factor-like uncharacterized protein